MVACRMAPHSAAAQPSLSNVKLASQRDQKVNMQHRLFAQLQIPSWRVAVSAIGICEYSKAAPHVIEPAGLRCHHVIVLVRASHDRLATARHAKTDGRQWCQCDLLSLL